MSYIKDRASRTLQELSEIYRDGISTLRLIMYHKTDNTFTYGRLRILIIDEMLPDPRFGAGYPRAAEIMQAVIDAGWVVTMYPMIAPQERYLDMRARYGANVIFLKSFGERGLRRLLRESAGQFDIVLVSRPNTMMSYARQLSFAPRFSSTTYCVYDAEAVFSVRDRQRRLLFNEPMSDGEYEDALSAEVAVTRGAQAVITVTNAEAQIFKKEVDAPVYVVSHKIVARFNTPKFHQRRDILFVGRLTGPREYSPNVDSMFWFIEEVMPLLDKTIGTDYKVIIAGLVSETNNNYLKSDRIIFKGAVDDLSRLYDACRVFIGPTRYSAGLPLKIAEASAMGIPCVVTELIANQISFEDGQEIICASDARSFADGCARLYLDEALWVSIQESALKRASTDYNAQKFHSSVVAALTPPEIVPGV